MASSDHSEEELAHTSSASGAAAAAADNSNEAVQQREVQVLPLDWTQMGQQPSDVPPVRYPSDVVADIDPDDPELCIVGTAGHKITILGSNFSATLTNAASLEHLILRSHMIKVMEGLEGFTSLELLELYDNQVQELACLEAPGVTLITLDMSYNVIRDMTPVSLCPNLQELCE
jgi:Leucine-rich repeat (LRR) protein